MQTREVGSFKLTRNQQLVLSVLENAGKPLTAYKILEHLKDDGINAPLQIYRALDKLITIGRVHRLESLNAFVVCCHAKQGHVHSRVIAFQICEECGYVREVHDERIDQALTHHARRSRFQSRHSSLEIHGICEDCSSP